MSSTGLTGAAMTGRTAVAPALMTTHSLRLPSVAAVAATSASHPIGGGAARLRARSVAQALQAAAVSPRYTAPSAAAAAARRPRMQAAPSAFATVDGGSGGGGSALAEADAPDLESPTAEVRMSTAAERAASTCALGPLVAARMQADCVRAVRAWCKMGYGDHLVAHVDHQQLASSSTPGLLTSAAVIFTGHDGRQHAAVAVTIGVRCPPSSAGSPTSTPIKSWPGSSNGSVAGGGGAASSSPSRTHSTAQSLASVAPGSSAPSLDPLPGLSLHWGCCQALGQRWQGPNNGWHTLPGVSYDAGKGAWQTPLAVRQAIPLDLPGSGSGSDSGGEESRSGSALGGRGGGGEWVATYSLVLQLPWEGAVRNGGLCFVLKTARDQWIKARAASAIGATGSANRGKGKEGGAEADFWIATAALPVVANGTPVLPDVFRLNQTDSLPAVGITIQPGAEPEVPMPTPAASSPPPSPAASIDSNGSKQAAAAGSEGSSSEPDLLAAAASFIAPPRHSDTLLRGAERHPLPAGPVGHCAWMMDHIAQREPQAERSLMHRYNAGADLVEMAAGASDVEEALAAITAWLRFSSARLLVWNRNYNIKPREISTAQGRLASALAVLGATRGPPAPGGRGSAAVGALVRVALAAVGRGGAGEVGQRIRDEILAIQQRNGCKGGMMEEWHQKLHNNTSPDDVVICQALLDYIASGLDVTAYWRTLSASNISAQRLASFDRPIHSEPRFSGQQAAGLQRDLTTYMETLQAVHGGDDLRSAVNAVLGYTTTDMKGKRIVVPAVPHVATPALARHLRSLLALMQHMARPQARAASPESAPAAKVPAAASAAAGGAGVLHSSLRPADVASLQGLPGAVRLMEMAVEARHLIKPFLDGGDAACGGRLVDVAFLDLALDSALRTAIESHIGAVKQAVADGTAIHIAAAAVAAAATSAGGAAVAAATSSGSRGSGRPVPGAFAASASMSQALEVVRLAAENSALSSCPNDDLVYSNKWLRLLVAQEDPRDSRDRLLQALAICDRLKRSLADQSAAMMGLVQPASNTLADRLGVRGEAVSGIGEEVVRGTSGAPLAQLLAFLEPALRRATGGGVWQIVSRGDDRPVLAGRLRVEPRLEAVQHEVMAEATVLLVEGITGAEEIPEGCVAVLVGSSVEGGGSGCPDILSHSAVRARNMGVLLAGCYSPDMVGRLKSHAGSRVMVRLEGSEVHLSFSNSTSSSTADAAGNSSSNGTAAAAAN